MSLLPPPLSAFDALKLTMDRAALTAVTPEEEAANLLALKERQQKANPFKEYPTLELLAHVPR